MAALSVLSASGVSTGTKFSRLILSGVASMMCSARVIMVTCKEGRQFCEDACLCRGRKATAADLSIQLRGSNGPHWATASSKRRGSELLGSGMIAQAEALQGGGY